MKVMISQPMQGKTESEIKETRNHALALLEAEGYEVINTLYTEAWFSQENIRGLEDNGVIHIPLSFLAKAIAKMACCDAVYFCAGWEQARGCSIEHEVAKQYGLVLIYDYTIHQ